MKILNRLIIVLALAAVFAGCRDRAAEKRIAELESRLAQIEGNSGAVATPAATPAAVAAAVPDERCRSSAS